MLRRSETGRASSPESFFSKKQMASSAGAATGATITAYSTGMISTAGAVTISLPIIIGTMIGILPAAFVSTHLSMVYDKKLALTPNFNALCQFTIRATTLILGLLLGLAAMSLLVSLTINPFTTPALIAGGVSAGLIVGLYVYAGMRMKALRSEDFLNSYRSTRVAGSHVYPGHDATLHSYSLHGADSGEADDEEQEQDDVAGCHL